MRLLALAVALGAIALSASPAQAITFLNPVSHHVALIQSNGAVPREPHYGNMPISSTVTGRAASENFGQFTFTNISLSQVTSTTLSHYDTIALIQVQTSSLSPTARTAIAQFVANGGKLLIHDADETGANDYSWLFPGLPFSTHVGAGCSPTCGARNGSSIINSNSSLISANPADTAYVNLGDLHSLTDAIGDSNLLVSTDPNWSALAIGTNALKEQGAQLAYHSNNNGLIVYNGYDTDFIKELASDPFQSSCTVSFPCPGFGLGATVTTDWLAQMWYSELVKGWGIAGGGSGGPGGGGGGAGLPQNRPLANVGTPLAAGKAGLPSNRLCVAGRRLALAVKKLKHLRGHQVVRVDVLVNGKLVKTERRHFRNVTLKHLPRHGTYTVTVIATTKRGFLLIARRRYHGC